MKTILAFAFLALSGAASAECVSGYCRGVGTEVAQTATVDSTGVYFMVPTGANLGCSLIEGVYIKLDRSNVGFRDMYATYLLAVSQNKYFQITVDGSATCTVASIRLWND